MKLSNLLSFLFLFISSNAANLLRKLCTSCKSTHASLSYLNETGKPSLSNGINDIEIIIFINNLFFEAFKGDLPCYTPFKNSQDEFSLFIPLRYIFPGLSDKKPIKLIEVNYKSKQDFNMVLWHAYEYNFAFANFIREKVREKYYIYNFKKKII